MVGNQARLILGLGSNYNGRTKWKWNHVVWQDKNGGFFAICKCELGDAKIHKVIDGKVIKRKIIFLSLVYIGKTE